MTMIIWAQLTHRFHLGWFNGLKAIYGRVIADISIKTDTQIENKIDTSILDKENTHAHTQTYCECTNGSEPCKNHFTFTVRIQMEEPGNNIMLLHWCKNKSIKILPNNNYRRRILIIAHLRKDGFLAMSFAPRPIMMFATDLCAAIFQSIHKYIVNKNSL